MVVRESYYIMPSVHFLSPVVDVFESLCSAPYWKGLFSGGCADCRVPIG
jgi:hypothetical protein